jgi:hypothetical protein
MFIPLPDIVFFFNTAADDSSVEPDSPRREREKNQRFPNSLLKMLGMFSSMNQTLIQRNLSCQCSIENKHRKEIINANKKMTTRQTSNPIEFEDEINGIIFETRRFMQNRLYQFTTPRIYETK